eukprot:TRINITY_DN44647_c0_g1_i1.p1 TRINITY_DN44647_c0_g1~~TRINITY_DN44647_c0_g1_i1.p1  ORF type:complete len:226 (+),score=19.08 TRINITY_DN44647_c0_g1_i1:95-772(+)
MRRPPRSTLSSSSAASDVYKRQELAAASEEALPRAMAPSKRRLQERRLMERQLLQQRSDCRLVEVRLNVYDVGSGHALATANTAMRDLAGIGGVFHAGVEIDGREWAYGAHDIRDRTGVFWCPPRHCGGHLYRETIKLGKVPLARQDIERLLAPLQHAYDGPSYDLLERNCCHFAFDFAKVLGVQGEFPPWVNQLATTGTKVSGAMGNLYDTIVQWGPKPIRKHH